MFACPSGDWLSCLFLLTFWADTTDYKLPALNGESTKVTVSGMSSGSSMGMMTHVIYSDWVGGAGLIEGTPYGPLDRANKDAMVQAQIGKTTADANAAAGKIAPVSNLENAPVLILRGENDKVVA